MKVVKINPTTRSLLMEFDTEEAAAVLRTKDCLIKDNAGQYYQVQLPMEMIGDGFQAFLVPIAPPRTYEIVTL